MREFSDDLLGLISGGGFARTWVADLLYDGDRRAQDLPLKDPSFSWDGNAQVQGSGSCEIVWADVFGRGIAPREIGDMFSPFGAELQVDMIVGGGVFSERIPMGRFVLDEVPAAVEFVIPGVAGGAPVVAESRVELDLKDYFRRVQRDEFPFPKPPSSSSMWAEASTITGLPVIRNIDDETIPTSVTYEEDRLKALDDLFAVAEAWPHLTPSGQLTARPKAWPAQVDVFRGIVSAPRAMSSERVYNRVVVEGKAVDDTVIRAVSEIRTGFLRVVNDDGTRSPFGGATYRYQSDFLTTYAQCKNTADTILERVSQLRAVTRTVTEPLMPLREVGDVVGLDGVPTRILQVSHDQSTTTSVVEVNP